MKPLLESVRHLFHPRRSNNHRARILHPDGFIFLTIAAFTVSAGLVGLQVFGQLQSGAILGFASDITVEQVIETTNQERARQGLPPLTLNRELSQAALAKGQDMLSDQYWAHTAPDGRQPWDFIHESGYEYQVAGENLARDFSHTQDMVKAWMASPTHKANILNPKYQEIGIGVIDGDLQGVETTLVVQMFGTPRQGKAVISEQADLDFGINPDIVPSRANGGVLASVSLERGTLTLPPLFSPLQLSKAFFLAIVLMLILTLLYDTLVIGNKQTLRIVGKNTSHIIFLTTVAFLIIFFKGGVIN